MREIKEIVLIFASTNLYKAKQLRVTIAKFNQRAQRVWKQLGFRQVEKFTKVGTEDEFIIMICAVFAF